VRACGRLWSNIASVTDAAVVGCAEVAVVVVTRGAGECGREGSGNDMEEKDGVGESTGSHVSKSDGSVLACRPAVRCALGARLGSWLVDSSATYGRTQHNRQEKSSTYTSSARKEKCYEYACTHHFR
jgi:hypothetical protein